MLERAKSEQGLSEKEYLEAKIDFVLSIIQDLEKYSLNSRFKNYSENTQIVIAQCCIKNNINIESINRLVISIKNEQQLLDILKDNSILKQYIT